MFPFFPGSIGPVTVPAESCSIDGGDGDGCDRHVWQARTTDVTGADQHVVAQVLADVAGLRRWLDGVEVACARRLEQLAAQCSSMFPEQITATATRTSLRHGARAAARAATTGVVPELGAALTDGHIAGEHVDVVTAALASLPPAQQLQLAAQGPKLAELAARLTPDEFRRQVTKVVHQLQADGGVAKLERQQRAVRLRTWVDKHTGTFRLSGELDPETGVGLIKLLDDRVDALFRGATPPKCPADPLARQGFLRAHALLDLINGGGDWSGSRSGSVAMCVTIDLTTIVHGYHARSRVDFGVDGIEFPLDTLRRMAQWADITRVLLDENGVVLKMGRTRRLASADQRKAIRAMYRRCVIPGCATGVRRCEPHHCDEWDPGGLTDIELLAPVCKRHHDRIHAKGWKLALAADRSLPVTDRHGTVVMTTGPPSEQWT